MLKNFTTLTLNPTKKWRGEDSTEEVDPSEEVEPDEGGTCSGDRCVPAKGSVLFLKTGQQIEVRSG